MSSVRTTTIDKVSTFLPPNADNPFVIDHSSTARGADAQPDGATVESETRMSIDYPSGIRITVDTHALVTALDRWGDGYAAKVGWPAP